VSDFSQAQLTPAYVAHARTTYARLARRFLPRHMASSILARWFEGRRR
jgi:hypothetical protein